MEEWKSEGVGEWRSGGVRELLEMSVAERRTPSSPQPDLPLASSLQRGGSESRPAHGRTDAKMPPLKSMHATRDLRRGRTD